MLLHVIMMTLAAQPSPPKLAATRVNLLGLPAERADFYTDHFADRLAERGISVITPREIASLIGLERQKALLGCASDSPSCMAEIANALGVDGLVLGDIAKVGDRFQVNLKIINAVDGRRLATHSESVAGEAQVLEALDRGALELSRSVGGYPRPPAEVVEAPQANNARRYWWIPGVVGAVGVGGGVAGMLTANAASAELREADRISLTFAEGVLQRGQTARTLGFIGLGVGVVGIGAAVALYLSGSETPAVAVVPTAEGAALSLSGAFP